MTASLAIQKCSNEDNYSEYIRLDPLILEFQYELFIIISYFITFLTDNSGSTNFRFLIQTILYKVLSYYFDYFSS